ncbi:hypothetical protein [Intrasporangium sp.]|uniref:hypothetical protein n=1 Tax=Intrasporangium sp. TaxID=1925024 RepID=UPI00293A1863|nr:hypothetical protein [Intrasporangium sp.]MDV3219953.1 hypothetical protein [Intrasporangium sp.]
MPTLTYPSPTFPGRPALRLDLPEGWEAVPAVGDLAGAALVAMRPEPAGEFRANLMVTLDEVPADHTVRYDLDGVERLAAERPQGTAGQVTAHNVGGVTFFGRDLSYVDDQAGTLLVRNLFGFLRRDVDGGLVRITVTGTVGSRRHREDYAELGTVIAGLRVTPGPGTTPLLDEEGAQ